ncbi:MAG: selenocysteine-specific translation elongation factor [Desulfuromonadales bacterium]|nr:selenocysteine-specific translation elongation factor [Desulfuromonadales bacterium]
MKHFILGTAGHIDHGKTSLVRVLTGIDTDRLNEEKKRGISIELGFAHLAISDDLTFGIVDVPGHERFIKSMVAGAAGIDMVMLVIAADEGIMPQTREHMDICRLLGVKSGLVALTKVDLVDNERIGVVIEEVKSYLKGSFLENCSIIPVSSKTREGINFLKDQLLSLSGEGEERDSDKLFRLPVDRVFTVSGFGTVVTGTSVSGHINVGDEIQVLPSGLPGRVRRIESYGEKSERGEAGSRLALNIQRIDYSQIERGDMIVLAGDSKVTGIADVRINFLDSSKKLKNRSFIRFHAFAKDVSAQIRFFDREILMPGDSAYAQLRLDEPMFIRPGDNFILRSYSPSVTIGGGKVLDPFSPKRRRKASEVLDLLTIIETGDYGKIMEKMVFDSRLSGVELAELVNRSGLSLKKAEKAIIPLLSKGSIIQVSDEPKQFLSKVAVDELKDSLLKAVAVFISNKPVMSGVGKEELKSCFPKQSNMWFFPAILKFLEEEGDLFVNQGMVKVSKEDSRGDLDETGRKVFEAIKRGAYEPPTVKELSIRLGLDEKRVLTYINRLLELGVVVKVKNDLYYLPECIFLLRDKLVGFLKEHKEIDPGEFRELTGLSRKFMIPVLEYFDQEKVTIRVGNKRVGRKL